MPRVLRVLCGTLAAVCGVACGPAATRVVQPNIILILTDDQDVDSLAFMPRTNEELVKQGLSFTRAFVTFPVCCPSRSSILLGQYVHNHKVLGNTPPTGSFTRFEEQGHEGSTVAVWLKAAGYRTAFLGKYLNGYPGDFGPSYVPAGWAEWYGSIGHYFGYRLNENGKPVKYGSDAEDYETDVLARLASDFIRQTSALGPVFMYIAPYAPHAPATPAPRHAMLFPDALAPRPPSFNEEDISDKPEWLQRADPLDAGAIASIDEHYRDRLRSLQAVDDLVGSLVDALRSAGALNQTYIFFTSDNGFHLGQHRLPPGKRTPYEEDIRVPLVVRGPGVPVAAQLGHLVTNADFAPTFADLAGVASPSSVDGRSLSPLFATTPPSQEKWRSRLLVEQWIEPDEVRIRPPDYAVLRSENLVYVEFGTGERELYDLRTDPFQLVNGYSTADSAMLKDLSSRLAELRACAGSSCRDAER